LFFRTTSLFYLFICPETCTGNKGAQIFILPPLLEGKQGQASYRNSANLIANQRTRFVETARLFPKQRMLLDETAQPETNQLKPFAKSEQTTGFVQCFSKKKKHVPFIPFTIHLQPASSLHSPSSPSELINRANGALVQNGEQESCELERM